MKVTALRSSKVLQLTLAIIKPDAVAHPLILESLHQKILDNNFTIVRKKDLIWRQSNSERFYAEHKGRFFYQRLVEFMSRYTKIIVPSITTSSSVPDAAKQAETIILLPAYFTEVLAPKVCDLDDEIATEPRFVLVNGQDFLVHFLVCLGPMRAYILAKDDAINHWRELMGPTKVYRARYTSPNTLRAQYGLTDTRNTTHGSDSLVSAEREIACFFPEFNVQHWLEMEEPCFRAGHVKYDLQKQIHTVPKQV